LTIGTLDGANIEIREEVGTDNIFIFGLRAEEIQEMRRSRTYVPREYCQRHPALQRVMDALYANVFSLQEPGLFHWFYHAILDHGDYYFHLPDLAAYLPTQEQAVHEYTQQPVWARKAILNVARIGKFSSDRTIREYANDIWKIQRV
jgi:starch phosphorylase